MKVLPEIVLVDLISYGHHTTFLTQFARYLLQLDCSLIIFFPDLTILNESLNSDDVPIENLRLLPIKDDSCIKPNRLKVLNRWRVVKKSIRKYHLNPDLIFFAWVDDFRFRKDHPILDKLYLALVEKFFPFKWSGLYFHPVHMRVEKSPQNQFAGYDIDGIFHLKNCTSVCILDPLIQNKLKEKTGKTVIRFPDFTVDSIDNNSAVANDLLIKAHGRKIILLIGAIMKRKGILTFLEAAKQSEKKPWLFAIAGQLFREDFSGTELQLMDQYILNPPENIWIYAKPLGESEFNSIVDKCDILYAAYFNFPHTSNMLIKASLYLKPLIVAKGFYMGETVSKLQIGEVVDESNATEVKNAIERILSSEKYLNDKSLEGFRIYRAENSADRLLEVFKQVLSTAELIG